VVINGDDDIARECAEIYHCKIGKFPIKYLEVPVIPSRLKVKDWAHLKGKNRKNWISRREGLCQLLGGEL
jgi:hypothetical protein